MPYRLSKPATRSASGFSLLELLVAISVASILLAIAVPSFTGIIISNRLTATTNELIGAINQARMVAVKRNMPTQFCSDSASNNGSDALGTSCGTSVGSVYTSGIATPLASGPQIPSSISIGSNATALRYAGNGLATTATGSAIYTGLVADISSSNIKENNHRCIYLATGSIVSSCKYTATSGACPHDEPTTCQQ